MGISLLDPHTLQVSRVLTCMIFPKPISCQRTSIKSFLLEQAKASFLISILMVYDFRMKIRKYEQFLIVEQIADISQKNMEFVKIALEPIRIVRLNPIVKTIL